MEPGGFHEALAALVGAKRAGTIVAAVGLALMLFGWLRGRAGRALGRGLIALSDDGRPIEPPPRASDRDEDRTITRGEWHDLRDRVNRAVWELDEVKRDLGKLEAAREVDRQRLEAAIADLTQLKAKASLRWKS